MNKIEYIGLSLRHGLKCVATSNTNIYNLLSIHVGNMTLCRVRPIHGGVDFPLPAYNIKPILRPLSDLTQVITHKGDNFIPINILREINDGDDIYISEFGVSIDNGYAAGYNLCVAFTFIDKLIEWNFDVFGLIKNSEAVDYHTLPDFVFWH